MPILAMSIIYFTFTQNLQEKLLAGAFVCMYKPRQIRLGKFQFP